MARVCFLGTPPAAVGPLRALVAAGHEVVVVVTRPDARRSRRGDSEPSPVKKAALELGLEVTDQLDAVTTAAAELGVVVAYGKIIPERVLDVVPMINIHFSLLPRWRGAAPVERAILAGDPTTGVCIMHVEAGLDTGNVVARAEVPIDSEETAEELTMRLSEVGADLLVETLAAGSSAIGTGTVQTGEPTYAKKIEPSELELDFEQSASQAARVVRVGRAWTTFRGSRLIVVKAEAIRSETITSIDNSDLPGTVVGRDVVTADGLLRLIEVQPEGRKRLAAEEWARGAKPAPGERLGG